MNEEDYEAFQEEVIKPLISVRDHLHWLAVMRQDWLAGLLEDQIRADLRLAYKIKGEMYRRIRDKIAMDID